MNIQSFDHGFPFIIVDDYFDEEEMEILWNEVDNLYKEDIFLDPADSYSAFDENGFLKMNKCIHLDEYFAKKREKFVRIFLAAHSRDFALMSNADYR